jgi:hypothetical protein
MRIIGLYATARRISRKSIKLTNCEISPGTDIPRPSNGLLLYDERVRAEYWLLTSPVIGDVREQQGGAIPALLLYVT